MASRCLALPGVGLAVLLLSGCNLPPPLAMEVLVVTLPPGAACNLSRLGQPVAEAGPTPAIALVEPTTIPIDIHCHRRGYADARFTLVPTPAPPLLAPLPAPDRPGYEQRVDIALVPR